MSYQEHNGYLLAKQKEFFVKQHSNSNYTSPKSHKRNYSDNDNKMNLDDENWSDDDSNKSFNKKMVTDKNSNSQKTNSNFSSNKMNQGEEDWDDEAAGQTSASSNFNNRAQVTNDRPSHWGSDFKSPSSSSNNNQPRGRFTYNSKNDSPDSGFRRSNNNNNNNNWNNRSNNFNDNKNDNNWDDNNNRGAKWKDRNDSNDNSRNERGSFRSNRGGWNDRGDSRDNNNKTSWGDNRSGWNDRGDSRDNNNKTSWGDNQSSWNDHGRSNENRTHWSGDNNEKRDDKPRWDSPRGSNRNYSQNTNSFGFKSNRDDDSSKTTTQEESTPKVGAIDWDFIRKQPEQNLEKFKDHPPVLKNFYTESTPRMTHAEAVEFRRKNFNIKIELFKKENLNYLKSDDKTIEKTPEEIEEFLRATVPHPFRTFEEGFSNYPELLEQLSIQKFSQPTPIQSQMWPILLKGLDCVGIAQTGTGKTLAFLLPALIHIDGQITPRSQRLGPNVLVLSPTRELAVQIEQEVKKINYKGIKSVCIYGGGDRKEQINVCTKGVEIIIGTPGRLYDLIKAGVINVTSVTYLVMDEADRMLDLGFEPQILKILLDIRPDRQTVMTSATWPEGVRRLATKYLREPIQLYVDTLDLRAAKTVEQQLVMLESDDDRTKYLMDYIENQMDEDDKVIVFVGRKATADTLSCDLILKGISCQSIHGDREQCDREQALEDFKDGVVKILIATDVASRGIDVKDITCVFNYDFPHNMEEYVHRVGRTGRAGRTGKSITLMGRQDWKHAKELIDILREGGQVIPKSLVDMAERYEAMRQRRMEEGGFGRGGGGGFGRGRGRGGRGGGGGRGRW